MSLISLRLIGDRTIIKTQERLYFLRIHKFIKIKFILLHTNILHVVR
jgi:hypothetical protein